MRRRTSHQLGNGSDESGEAASEQGKASPRSLKLFSRSLLNAFLRSPTPSSRSPGRGNNRACRRDSRDLLKRPIATPLAPGIEITWLPSVVPAGPKKKEFAVPERTTVGSPGFQSRASAESMSTTFETPSKGANLPSSVKLRPNVSATKIQSETNPSTPPSPGSTCWTRRATSPRPGRC